MSWQRDLYAVVEDCKKTLAPDTAELFDREANVFASEVLFQLDTFTVEAEAEPFGVRVPLKLRKKYGGSIYATIRRYVSRSRRACAVLVLEPPEIMDGDGFRCDLRRVVASESFLKLFGHISWPDPVTPSDQIGAMVPLGKRRMSGKRTMELKDRNGGRHECFAEAFTQTYQVFLLIFASEAPLPTLIASAAVST